jgi:hypothetical protein
MTTFWRKARMAAVVLCAAVSAAAAGEKPPKRPGSGILPSDRLADWRPGVLVGVPGGIPRTVRI